MVEAVDSLNIIDLLLRFSVFYGILKSLKSRDLKNLKASKLKWLASHRCKHGNLFISHPTCYETETYIEDKVLFFDIETTAHEGFYWGRGWETNIIETIRYGKILSFAAKWKGGHGFSKGWLDYKRHNERNLVKEIWSLFDEADFIVAHNGKQFDVRWCNTKFTQYRLGIPSPYKVIDTKSESKKYLYLPSHSLNNIADYFDLGAKMEHEGFSLWKKCIAGNKEAWRKMKKYNLQDVLLLEKVYDRLQPFRQKSYIR